MKHRPIIPVLMLTGATVVLALITAGCGEQRKVDLSAEEQPSVGLMLIGSPPLLRVT